MSSTTFLDLGFRLACIDAFHVEGLLPDVFDDDEEADFEARLAMLDTVELTDEMLSKITRLAPDGGDDVYLFLDPEWGAENRDLYISRFDDLVHLTGLKSLSVHSVTAEEALDLSLLLKCEQLQRVKADSYYVKQSDENAAIIAELTSRGVEIKLS